MSDITAARNLLLSLIYPTTDEDMTEEQAAQFAVSVDEQAEYSQNISSAVKSESVGDVSVTYESSSYPPFLFYGQPISPSVIGRLARCGLMRRWV